jgi:RimJ/RimL family protein N-acetyltransferase
MRIKQREYSARGITYIIRSAVVRDAEQLSAVRLRIDGETENLDREQGEAFIDASGFEQLIQADSESTRNLFLVAAIDGRLVGFSRCEGSPLRRFSHKVEFGVCVLKDFWGYGIGRSLVKESVSWADSNEIRKINLQVLETNITAIELYKKFGFEIEGTLKNDKVLSDGKLYNTIIMGRSRT